MTGAAAIAMLAAAAGAQVQIPGSVPGPTLSMTEASEMVRDLRLTLVRGPQAVTGFLEPRAHPAALATLDLGDVVSAMMWHSQPVIGCAAEGPVVGFYSPLFHVWLAVLVDRAGGIRDARLGRGFPADAGGTSVWWPDLLGEAGSIPNAIRLATFIQLAAFDALFDPQNCPGFAQVRALAETDALHQYIALSEDYENIGSELGEALLVDLGQATGTDLSTQWRAEVRLGGTGTDWLILLSSFHHPGTLLLARYVPRADGLIHYQGHALIDFVPEPAG